MNDAKPWYTSRAVWGSLMVLLAGGLSLVKVSIAPDLQAELVEWLVSLGTLIGGLLSLVGRLKAQQAIGPSSTGETPVGTSDTGETPVPRTDDPAKGSGWLSLLFFCLLPSAFCLLISGCGNLDTVADEARLNAVRTPIQTHVEKYPEQAQSWADFVRAWEKSIEARKAAKLPL